MFEIAVTGGVKGDDDRHSFTERKLRFTPTSPTSRNKSLIPKGFKFLTKVIQGTKQFSLVD
jgi:hypothetical protein